LDIYYYGSNYFSNPNLNIFLFGRYYTTHNIMHQSNDMKNIKFDLYRINSKALKYFIFGLSMGSIAYIIFDKCQAKIDEILMLSVVASLVFAIFDMQNKSESTFCL